MLRRISAIIYKECLHISRDIIALSMLIFFPVFALFLFGVAINLDIKHIPLAVYDLDRSETSRKLTESFIQSGYFDLKDRFFSEKQINPSLDKRKVKAVLRIPPDFSKDIHKGKGKIFVTFNHQGEVDLQKASHGYERGVVASPLF